MFLENTQKKENENFIKWHKMTWTRFLCWSQAMFVVVESRNLGWFKEIKSINKKENIQNCYLCLNNFFLLKQAKTDSTYAVNEMLIYISTLPSTLDPLKFLVLFILIFGGTSRIFQERVKGFISPEEFQPLKI